MALRVPKAELPPELRENMIKQLGAVPEPVEVTYNNPLPAWRGRSEPGQAVAVWLRGRCQISSQWLLASRQRRAMMASAPGTVQRIPDNFRRWPTTALQPASTTPEPTNRPRERNHL